LNKWVIYCMSIKDIIKRLVWRKLYNQQASSEYYIEWLKERGAKIGQGCVIFNPQNTMIDVTRPYMLDIGNYVQISSGVSILTHGYEWSILKAIYGDICGSCGKVAIGDNVYIGVNAVILKGITVGNNVIIGACSCVTKDCDSNSVYAGVPARRICSLDEFHEKRIASQLSEVKEQIRTYYLRTGKRPDRHILREFFYLFEKDADDPEYSRMLDFMGNGEFSTRVFKESRDSRPFDNINQLIDDALLYLDEPRKSEESDRINVDDIVL
jgi:acetyltransferase-like isoleucine patch superfamily enzyme